ncbi:MAG: hypothetical protein NWQ13_08650, partial [Glaciimonas sp.]|nr:hypothetical protein [Glaciimonas sp.]
ACTAAELINDAPSHGLLFLDELSAPALTGEWATWREQLLAMENDWFAPLLQALKNGKLDQISLIFTDNTRMTAMTTTRLSLKKFWIKPSLKFFMNGITA